MEKTKVKKRSFDLGIIAQIKGDELSRIPLIKLYYFSIAISILLIVLVLFTQESLPPQIPLYFGLAEGEDQLAQPIELLYPPISSLVITITNSIIVLKLKNQLMQKVFAVSSFVVAFFSFVTTVRILLLVGSFH